MEKVHCFSYGGSRYILTAVHPLEDWDGIFLALPLAQRELPTLHFE